VFPPDDEVGQWIVMLAAAGEDLAASHAHLQSAVRPGETLPPATGYHFRLVAAQTFEARRPILALESRAVLRGFVDGIDAARAPLAYLRSAFVPSPAGGVSPAHAAFAPPLQRTIHHPWPGSRELRNALAAACDEPACRLAHVVADHGRAAGDAGARERQAGRVRLAAGIAAAFRELVAATLLAYLTRRGLDATPTFKELRVGIG
jgi:hypothetical protein